ncbi:MAG: restriction endonuclease subunit S [Candidatus Sericytochromatia bacterium]
MSNLDFMEKMLKGVEIEWKLLGEVSNFTNGKGHEKDILENGKYIVVNSKFISTNGKIAKYSEHQICPLFADDILIVMSDLPNGNALAKTFFVDENEKYTLNQRIGGIRVKDNKILFPNFLNVYLNRTSQLIKYDDGVNQTNLRKDQILEVKIPIPPIDVQKKIVQILDLYTNHKSELIENLTAELSARKKQYNYYREKLLTFEEGKADFKPLGEVGELIRGNGLQKKDFTETGVPAIHYGQIYTKYGLSADKTFSYVSNDFAKKLRPAYKNDLLIATTSENDEDVLKSVAWLGEKAVISGDMMLFRHEQNVKYLAYYFKTEAFQTQKIKYISGTKVRRVSKDNLEKIIIPIPPIEEQNRIVSILDKFDALTNSISEGLPREIKLRQQQYEYYRDLLLSFPSTPQPPNKGELKGV